MPLDYKIIGKNIQTRRKQMHITQQKMADDLFLSASLISKVERGVKPVSLDTFQAIAEYLNTNIAVLVEEPEAFGPHRDCLFDDICKILETFDGDKLQTVYEYLKNI